MKGGHSNSGRLPDPNALRRDRDGLTWTTLPASGRVGDTPPWPLTRATPRELALWDRQWRRPQAVMWETNGQHEEVALYVRSLAFAERPGSPVSARTLVRQQQEALGLSLGAMARLRWRIGDVDAPTRPRPATSGASAKERWSAVTGIRPEGEV